MPKADDGRGGSVQDVEVYFNQIRTVIKQYRRVVDKLTAIKTDKKKALERVDLINERKQLKETFISKKTAARGNIKLLKQGLDVLKERELGELQAEFREIDGEFKALGVMADSDELFEGRRGLGARNEGGFDPSKAKNDDLLNKAKDLQDGNLAKLKSGLQVVEQTKEQAKYTAAVLEQDREKLKRIDSGLDEVQSELELSRVLLTRFVKRLYTDKVIIAFTFLLVVGIAGIVTYSILNPDQKIFNVPSVVAPNFIPGVSSPTPTPSPGHVRRVLARAHEPAAAGASGPFGSGSSDTLPLFDGSSLRSSAGAASGIVSSAASERPSAAAAAPSYARRMLRAAGGSAGRDTAAVVSGEADAAAPDAS